MPHARGALTPRVHWLRTLMAKGSQPLDSRHLRYVTSRPGAGVFHCVLLDCSGSMLLADKLAHAKGFLLALFDDAGRRRHQVALVCFGGDDAQRRFGPAIPRWWNERWIAPIGGGGGTALRRGVEVANTLLRDAQSTSDTWLWLLTDGRSADIPPAPHADRLRVVDVEQGPFRLTACANLAALWQADYVRPYAHERESSTM